MPLKKIQPQNDTWTKTKSYVPCNDPEHKPPSHMVYEPGEYEWTCPSCGKVTKFIVPYIGL